MGLTDSQLSHAAPYGAFPEAQAICNNLRFTHYWLELGHMATLSAGVAGKYRDSPFQNRIRVVEDSGYELVTGDTPPQGWFSCWLRREWPQGFLVSEPLQGHPLILLRDRVCEMASQ